MQYHALGKTEMCVSAIGFGASTLGNVFGDVSFGDGERAVHCGIEHGINFFDVAPYYGMTVAEERLGDALHDRRDRVLLGTKCGRYRAGGFDFSPATVRIEFERSLRRLRTDYVDLLQVHDIEFGDLDQIEKETLPMLRRLQEEGKARYVGITGYWPSLLAEVALRTPVDTVLNYCHFNLMMNDMDEELTPAAVRAGFGLINASPLHMGLLGGTPIPAWHPAPTSVLRAAQEIVSLCHRNGMEPATVALHACLRHPVVATTLVGMSSVAEVKKNCLALDCAVSTELLEEIRHCAGSAYNTAWTSGLPENNPLLQSSEAASR